MARLSDLAATLEEHRVDTGATLNLFSRRLREAGRVSKAGRGRGAASMTFLDAARFAIACFATDHPEQAADAEFVFSNTVFSGAMPYGAEDQGFALDREAAPTLDLGLAALLAAIADGAIDRAARRTAEVEAAESNSRHLIVIPPQIEVDLSRGGVSAAISVQGSRWIYHHPALVAVTEAPDYLAQKPLLAAYERETHRFRTGKDLRAKMDGKLLRGLASTVAGGNLQ